jgi:asparagine synthase (glutamine-hydrolysing)
MCAAMRHRGPDDQGTFVEGGCAIGMRRLSIIDLEGGHQPIANEDGSVVVVFNGEIYNYRELRAHLIAAGHRLITQSDTETLVHLYEDEGIEGLKRLRGMFAFAIWDRRRRRLFLARDRFGKKPLYFAHLDDGLYFASELKCLRAAGIPLDLDEHALRMYFWFTYVPDPHSIFRQVKKVAPGGWLLYEPDTGRVEQGRYWRPPQTAAEPASGLTEDTAAARIREVFDESVRLRMIADVPLGAFLSGGIDSSSVVASMAEQSATRVKTFSIGFEEADFNELEYARVIAKKYNTDHHETVVRPDALSMVQRIVKFHDEPFGDSSSIPTFIVSEAARQHVKVVLTGDGGDELFCGYESFWGVDRLRRLDAVPQSARRVVSMVAEALPWSAYGKNWLRMASRPTALERYFEFNYAPWFLREQLLTPKWRLPSGDSYLRSEFPDFLLPEGADIVSQAMYFEATAKLAGDMLVKVDRMSMANSIEVRCPMLDHELASVAAEVPFHWNLPRPGERQGKRMFIRAMGDRLPEVLINRKKMGFGVPLSHWMRTTLRDYITDHLTSRRFLDRGIFSEKFIHTLIDEHMSGRRNNQYWMWTLLMFELWMRDWEVERINRPAAAVQLR